jgi:hypothetical protein
METRFLKSLFTASLAGLLFAGCGKAPSSAPVALPEEEIPATVSAAFKDADKDTQDGVNRYVSAVKAHDIPTAFEELQTLSHVQGLSDDQRSILARASRTTSQKLQEAAANGDSAASDALKTFKSTK